MIRSAALLLVYLFAGTVVARLSAIPVPGSVIGMVLLTLSLHLGVVKLPDVAPAAGVLLRHMALFYVPPGVGVMLYFGLIRAEWVAIVAANVASTIVVLLAVGGAQQALERRQVERRG